MKKAATVWTEAAKDEEKRMKNISINQHEPQRKPRREYRDDTPVGIKMDMFKLRVLMLKALAELVDLKIDEERRT